MMNTINAGAVHRDLHVSNESGPATGRRQPASSEGALRPDLSLSDSDPKIKTSIEIIIRTAYPRQVRETNGVDPQNIPMPRPNWILLLVGHYASE